MFRAAWQDRRLGWCCGSCSFPNLAREEPGEAVLGKGAPAAPTAPVQPLPGHSQPRFPGLVEGRLNSVPVPPEQAPDSPLHSPLSQSSPKTTLKQTLKQNSAGGDPALPEPGWKRCRDSALTLGRHHNHTEDATAPFSFLGPWNGDFLQFSAILGMCPPIHGVRAAADGFIAWKRVFFFVDLSPGEAPAAAAAPWEGQRVKRKENSSHSAGRALSTLTVAWRDKAARTHGSWAWLKNNPKTGRGNS